MALPDATRNYIDGRWVEPSGSGRQDVVNPATEEVVGQVALSDADDVAKAVAAARAAFPAFASTPLDERKAMLGRIVEGIKARQGDFADAISAEMGAPAGLASAAQAPTGMMHFATMLKVLDEFEFEEVLGTTKVRKEPIGVVAMITPWNWPFNQIACKVAPALAAGCTMVLKPSEFAPLDAVVLAEILDEAGVPPGVFNLVHGDGEGVGAPLTSHPDVDMVSFTGSTRAGVAISKAAADTVKRVALELGGKSANIVLDDADFAKAIPASVMGVMVNSGQSCNAQTRLFVPRERYAETVELAKGAADAMAPGTPRGIGPLANANQYRRVLGYIETGKKEGATLVTGGTDRPEGLDKGYYVRPTVFGDVTPDMTIAREEIFGPVIAIFAYDDLDEAIEEANANPYGLSGAVWSGDPERAYAVASRLRTGMVHLNGAQLDGNAPFGGYKMSGNGREWGRHGLEEFLETKSVYGAAAA
ncbi:aldehyde dehydrogenase family protein [Qipengyuania sp. JC766]|uniref:aldehyde dehydrogenase family protein n=1 Tax=Qipengyuania sp. JC766 TaxID=3232139 RepID=UPI00345ADEFB